MPPFGATDSTAASWNKKGSLVKADFAEMNSFGELLLVGKNAAPVDMANITLFTGF